MTPKKAPIQATKSNLSIFQISFTAYKSIRLITADMMIADRIALGVYLKSGVRNAKVSSTTMDITMLETAVWQPAM
ncbi:hypothetical protein IC582_016097 [Cucumis melo]